MNQKKCHVPLKPVPLLSHDKLKGEASVDSKPNQESGTFLKRRNGLARSATPKGLEDHETRLKGIIANFFVGHPFTPCTPIFGQWNPR